jgi:hypothetical protein
MNRLVSTEGGSPAQSGKDFPFRFYGSRPLEAYEAANDGHFFELCFVRAPEKDALEAIAELFEQRLIDGPASPAHAPWVWAGRWARFALGERFVSPDSFYARVRDLLKAVHALQPLEQVVNFNVRAFGEDEWERWSVAQRPVPTTGPAYESFSRDAYRREYDSTLKPAPEPAFEATRSRVRSAAESSRAAAAAKGPLAAGKIALVPVSPEDVPPATDSTEHAQVRALFAESDWVGIGPSGRAVALIRGEGFYTTSTRPPTVGTRWSRSRIPMPCTGCSSRAARRR